MQILVFDMLARQITFWLRENGSVWVIEHSGQMRERFSAATHEKVPMSVALEFDLTDEELYSITREMIEWRTLEAARVAEADELARRAQQKRKLPAAIGWTENGRTRFVDIPTSLSMFYAYFEALLSCKL